MKISHFFIDRPVFATVISVMITLTGAIALWGLPLAQYPEIMPPAIQVTITYPAASARTWPTRWPSRSSSRSTAWTGCSTCRRKWGTTALIRFPSPSTWART